MHMQSHKSQILSHFQLNDVKIHEIFKNSNSDDWFLSINSSNLDEHFLFTKLCREIISQQLSGKSASAIFGRFKKLFQSEHIDPQILVDLDKQILRDCGLSWAKVSYVKDLAEKLINKEIHLGSLNSMTDEEVIAELIKVKGIGKWTAEMFLMFTLGREDVFSYGDLGLNKGFCKVYEIENPTKDYIEKIIDKWSPYKSYASLALWKSLEK